MPIAAIAGIGAIGSIAGGILGSNAASHAADTQAAAANNAAQLERQTALDALNFNKLQYGNSLKLLSPFYNTGTAANSRLAYLMGLTPNQGLPFGVTDPSAPSSPAALNGSMLDPGAIDQLRALRGGAGANGNRMVPFSSNASMINPANYNTPPLPSGNPATPSFNMSTNTPITSPGANQYQMTMNTPITSGGSFGATGMLGANGQPLPDVNPMPNGANLGTVTPQSANGSPGQVPQTGNGGNFSLGPINAPNPGEGMFTGQDPQGFPASGPGNLPEGTFGSLAQGWNRSFTSPTANDMTLDPGYKFRLQQGMDALQNSAAARGGLLSGGTARAVNDYAQGSASQEYGNAYNRALQNYNTNYNTFTNDQTNTFNRLMALMGGGQVSANNLSSAGVNAANANANIGLTSAGAIGQDLNNAAAARGSGYVNSANAINGAIGGAGNSLSLLALMNMMNGGASSGGSSGGWGVF